MVQSYARSKAKGGRGAETEKLLSNTISGCNVQVHTTCTSTIARTYVQVCFTAPPTNLMSRPTYVLKSIDIETDSAQ
jgi:hypothetical protein